MKSKLCDLLGIRYPIMQGGMQWLATPELAAAVSNGGGLGTLNSSLSKSKQELREAIRRVRDLTDRPFAVNISMLPHIAAGELVGDFLEVVIQARVPVVETSGRDPKDYVGPMKAAGIKTIHKVPAVRFAKKAEQAGVDAVTVVGFECGGHPGMDDVGNLVLIPSVVDAVHIPVIAGGGVCDGRSYLAMRCLGAEGVVVGTRFLASEECPIHPAFQQAVLSGSELDTMMVQRSIKNASRVYKNDAAKRLYEMECNGRPTLEEILAIVSGARQKECYEKGDTSSGAFPIGQCMGRINDIVPAAEIIRRIIGESEAMIKEFSAP